MNFKVVIDFAFSKWKWSEPYYWVGNPGSLGQCRNDVRVLCLNRCRILDNNIDILGATLVQCDGLGRTIQAGAGERMYGGLTLQAAKITGDCTPVWLSLLVTAYDLGGNYRRNMYIRGIPQDYLCDVTTLGYSGGLIASTLYSKLKKFLSVLTQSKEPIQTGTEEASDPFSISAQVPDFGRPALPPGDRGALNLLTNKTVGRFAFLSTSKPLGRQILAQPLGLLYPDDGTPLLLRPNVGTVFGLNDAIHIHGVGGTMGRSGANGDARITGPVMTEIGLAGYYPTSRANLTPDCVAEWDGTGVWWRRVGVFWNANRFQVARVVRHATGVRTDGTKGRKKKRRKKSCLPPVP